MLICLSAPANGHSTTWNKGVAIVHGEPKYFDPSKFDIPQMQMTRAYIRNHPKNIVPAAVITWLREHDGSVYAITHDHDKTKGSEISEGSKRYYYTIRDAALYVSADAKTWDRLRVRFLNRKPYVSGGVMVWWRVRLTCRWFEGEYEIFSTAIGT
ncbi:MAG TPA: hypothetical protein PKM65_18830 [Spirochaetota bacterium]|nr:hypothetical protein [Spirochaetota bacterium]HNT11435.1 hypothetical protein [Spirochaetota bacterium]